MSNFNCVLLFLLIIKMFSVLGLIIYLDDNEVIRVGY
jgi:hypothetical protein